MTKNIEKIKKTKSVKNTKPTRTKKNKKLYGQKIVIKNKKIHKAIIALLVISLLVNGLTMIHFLTFNHNKVKTITKITEKEVVPENIVFLGDSITWMYDLDKYYKEKNVVNSGINGNTTSDILNEMKTRIYQYNPSKVFLLIGTNDITHKKTNEEIVNNIKEIIVKIQEKRPNCKIYLESIYPVNNTDNEKINHRIVENRTNKVIHEINQKLKEYTKENEKVTYIDIYSKLIDDEENIKLEYTNEGLHISDEGYELITKELKKYIN